jgi:hypothetical protein
MIKLFSVKQHGSAIIDLEFSPGGKQLASSSDEDQTVWLWSTEKRAPIKMLDGRRLAFSPDSRLLVTCGGPTADRKMAVWNGATGAPAARVPGRDLEQFFDAFFTPDGDSLIGVSVNGIVRTWDKIVEIKQLAPPPGARSSPSRRFRRSKPRS